MSNTSSHDYLAGTGACKYASKHLKADAAAQPKGCSICFVPNTAMKMPAMGMGGGSNERINFLNTDPKYIKKNKIKVVGTETFLDRECTKYTVAVFMMGQVVKKTSWVYKGIVLKSSKATDFGEMVQQATNLVEDVEIPASTFEVPEGITIQEMSRGGGPGGPMGGGGFGGGGFPQF